MPASKSYPITSAYIELLHDNGIALSWPGVQPVGPQECLDLNLLNSAAEQPFQAGFGVEFYPSIFDKAACLFFSIAGGHIFSNGNKRTAVLAVDQFLLANEVYLAISNDEMEKIAEETASYRIRGENHEVVKSRLSQRFKSESIPFQALKSVDGKFHWRLHRLKRLIRNDPRNQEGARPIQLR